MLRGADDVAGGRGAVPEAQRALRAPARNEANGSGGHGRTIARGERTPAWNEAIRVPGLRGGWGLPAVTAAHAPLRNEATAETCGRGGRDRGWV